MRPGGHRVPQGLRRQLGASTLSRGHSSPFPLISPASSLEPATAVATSSASVHAARAHSYGCREALHAAQRAQDETLTWSSSSPLPLLSPARSQVEYFNKRRVLQLRQDLMERKAAEQIQAQGAKR